MRRPESRHCTAAWKAAVSQAVEDEYPSLRKAAGRTLSGSGGRSGWIAGQRADLGGTRVTRRPRGQVAG